MEGTFKNGDTWNGYRYQEDNTWWFRATDKDGNIYDTQEEPSTEPILTITQYVGNWSAEEIDECQAGVNPPTYNNKAW